MKAFEQIARGRRLRRSVAIVALGLWVSVGLAADPLSEREQRARDYFGNELLIDQQGQRVAWFDDVLRQRTVLISFVFTHCDSACPMTIRRLRDVRNAMGDAPSDVLFVSLSIDPERDTADALRRFATAQGATEPYWRFLAGRDEAVRAVVGRLGQPLGDPENHSTLLIAGNASAGRWKKIPPTWSPQQVAEALRDIGAPR